MDALNTNAIIHIIMQLASNSGKNGSRSSFFIVGDDKTQELTLSPYSRLLIVAMSPNSWFVVVIISCVYYDH